MASYPSHARPGAYIGTTVGDVWWRRYRRDGFLARGNGRYWLDGDGFHFLRALTKTPLLIPSGAVTRTSMSGWHAGRWAAGIPILRIHWTRDGAELLSGFAVSRDPHDIASLCRDIEAFATRS